MLIKPFQTERLFLRPLEKTDTERLYLLDSNPEVMKYVGQPVLTKTEESEKVIEFIQNQYEKSGIGRFAVIEKLSGLLIGWCGLKFIDYEINGHQNFYELGYRFLPEFWGKGFAQESCKPFIQKAFKDLDIAVLYAYVHCENIASNKVLQKLGFLKNGEFQEPDGICFWYEMENKYGL